MNSKQHMTAGAVLCGGANLVWQLYKLYDSPQPPSDLLEALSRVDFLEVGVFTAGGALFGVLPDILEPANSPNHRAFFHSIGFGAAVTYGALGKHSQEWCPDNRFAVAAALLAYLSHLCMDGSTPKGLPVI